MSNLLIESDWVLLLKLLLAHFLSDFFLQSNSMIQSKSWFSKGMLLHILVVFVLTGAFSFLRKEALLIACIHYVLDGLKMTFNPLPTFKNKGTLLFILDQLGHILTVFFVWIYVTDSFMEIAQKISLLLNDKHVLLGLLGYILVTTPAGYLIDTATKKMDGSTLVSKHSFTIGILERILILTFVLVNQYTAIGLMLVVKNFHRILNPAERFTSVQEDEKSEYVFIGTLISYGIAIGVGIGLKLFISC